MFFVRVFVNVAKVCMKKLLALRFLKVCSKTMCSAHKASTKCEPGRKKVAKLVPITKCDSSSLTTAYGQRQRACKRLVSISCKNADRSTNL